MNEGNKKKIVQAAVFIVTFAVAFLGTKYLMASFNSSESELKKISVELNKSCPKMIDAVTRLDSTNAIDDILQYNYTLVSVSKESSKLNLNDAKGFIMYQSQRNLDTNSEMKYFREKKISLKYIYNDKSGNPLFNFTIKSKNKN